MRVYVYVAGLDVWILTRTKCPSTRCRKFSSTSNRRTVLGVVVLVDIVGVVFWNMLAHW